MELRLAGCRPRRWWCAAAWVLAACGAGSASTVSPEPSPHVIETCKLVAIEQVPAPIDQKEDAVYLVARYRAGEARDARDGSSAVLFQVASAREHDLRLHLQAHPNVVCGPDRRPAEVEVPSFEGQRGQPVP